MLKHLLLFSLSTLVALALTPVVQCLAVRLGALDRYGAYRIDC